MIYLDTHIVIWFHAQRKKAFPSSVRTLMNQHDFIISPMVRLELQYLFEIGRITQPADSLITDMQKTSNLTICPKPFDTVAQEATTHSWTNDPFDRLIVAQASLSNDILVTRDRNILANYSQAFWG